MIKQLKPEDRKGQETTGERITRIARKFLCEMAPDQQTLLNVRNYYWDMSDYYGECGNLVDRELRKRRRQNKKWKKDRPKAAEIKTLEMNLKSFIGGDREKLEFVEKFLSWFPLTLTDPMRAQQSLAEARVDITEAQRIFRVLTRGKGGRPPTSDDVKARAYAMQREGKTIGQIARALWPDAYKENPIRARQRMKSTLYRHKKQSQQETAKHQHRDKNPAGIL